MLKRYSLKNEGHSGWAIILLDTDIGFFATVSDYGNYAYLWSAPGMEFRKFLLEVEPDYLLSKLLHGCADRLKVFDGEATKKAILKYIEENEAIGQREQNQGKYAREKELLEECRFNDQSDFEAWQSETLLDEPWELGCWVPDRQCTAFCAKVMPRFQKLLQEELEKEKT
jgi:hypothetical protein